MASGTLLAVAAIATTLSIFLSGVIFGAGGLMARVKSLEDWRGNIRQDMHEISDVLEKIKVNLASLQTLVQMLADQQPTWRGRHGSETGRGPT